MSEKPNVAEILKDKLHKKKLLNKHRLNPLESLKRDITKVKKSIIEFQQRVLIALRAVETAEKFRSEKLLLDKCRECGIDVEKLIESEEEPTEEELEKVKEIAEEQHGKLKFPTEDPEDYISVDDMIECLHLHGLKRFRDDVERFPCIPNLRGRKKNLNGIGVQATELLENISDFVKHVYKKYSRPSRVQMATLEHELLQLTERQINFEEYFRYFKGKKWKMPKAITEQYKNVPKNFGQLGEKVPDVTEKSGIVETTDESGGDADEVVVVNEIEETKEDGLDDKPSELKPEDQISSEDTTTE